MGLDFQYFYARIWCKNLDKLIHYVYVRQATGSKVNAFQSMPCCYLYALNNANQTWSTKDNAFFSYGSGPHTGKVVFEYFSQIDQPIFCVTDRQPPPHPAILRNWFHAFRKLENSTKYSKYFLAMGIWNDPPVLSSSCSSNSIYSAAYFLQIYSKTLTVYDAHSSSSSINQLVQNTNMLLTIGCWKSSILSYSSRYVIIK